MLGSPQHPLPCRVPHCKVLAVWGDPWDVGSMPWSGFAHRAGWTHHGSPNPQSPPPALCLHTEQGVSQGLGSPWAVGPHPATNSRWLLPLALGMETLSLHNPSDGHPASAARAAVPSPSCARCEAQVRMAPALDGCSGLCRWSMGDLSRDPTRCHPLGEQNQPAGSRSHPAPQKHSTVRPHPCSQ